MIRESELPKNFPVIDNYESRKDLWYKMVRHITRPGISDLVYWIKNNSDYLWCPASSSSEGTKHGYEKGGLLNHSLNVFENLNILNMEKKLGLELESMVIMGLFHDLCKANSYISKKELSINESGEFVKQFKLSYSGSFPMGHGEKSVVILQGFIQLSEYEMLAIRWHLGAWDHGIHGYPGKYQFSAALVNYPSVGALIIADQMAQIFDELLKKD